MRLLMPVVIITMVIVLHGINIAATTGFRRPCMANHSPIILYTIEMIKLIPITTRDAFASFKIAECSFSVNPS